MREPALDRRALIAGGLALGLSAAAPPREIVVAADGSRDARTLAEALARAAPGSVIRLTPGSYREKLHVTVPDVTIVGAGPRSTVTYGAYSGQAKPDGTGSWGTSGSATLTIDAPGVTLRDLIVRNDFDYVAHKRNAAGEGAQAVALAVGRGADRTRITRCGVEGYQDTLLVQTRALIEDCRISGNVDFIFGAGATLFRRCTIVTRHVPGAESGGYLAAPSTPAAQAFGFVFRDCRIERERGVPDASTWLGRPWRAGGNMSLLGAAAFIDCWMDAHIRRDGWTSMGYRAPDGNRTMLTPQEARLSEYGSRGPGAAPAADTRRMLTAAEARGYTPRAILSGWTP